MTSLDNDRASRTPAPPGLFARMALALSCAVVLSLGCDVHTPGEPGSVALITVTPNVTLAVGATQQFTAVGTDADGLVVDITPVWSVIAGGGTINANGLFTAGNTPGVYTATVQATSGGISGTADVTVIVGVLASIVVTPNPDTLAVTATRQFTAVGYDIGNNVVAITPTWTVTNGGGAINSTGLFTAGTVPGTYANTVRATNGSIFGQATVVVTAGPLATITVTPNPDTLAVNTTRQFTAVGRDASNNVVPITPVWSVTNSGGTIDAGGLFTAGTVLGTFTNTVRATSGSIFGQATVVVTAGPLASITVTPDPDTLNTGATRQFTAVGKDASNNVIPITPVWSVTNSGGTIDAGGLFTAGGTTGTFLNTVRATSGTIFGTATVVVTSAGPVIPLGLVAPYGIMAGLSFTCINNGLIQADIAISPGSTVTGFPPCVITGVQHLADGTALAAQNDLTTLYNTLQAEPCPPANAIVADLGGTTKPAGVYCTASGIGVTGTLTLDGGNDPNALFVFQAGTSLITAGDIVLINLAQAQNVYWVVGSSATLGTGSQWKGNVVALTSITLVDTANLIGRALARNGSVSLGTGNTITLP